MAYTLISSQGEEKIKTFHVAKWIADRLPYAEIRNWRGDILFIKGAPPEQKEPEEDDLPF